MTCGCGSDSCTCIDQCLCYPCFCCCHACVELRRNLVCKGCGLPKDCVMDRLPYLMPLPDLSFLNNQLPTAGTSGESAKPDDPGKPESKNLTSEERKELYSQPMMFQMDDIDTSTDERESRPEGRVAPHFISIRSLPNPCIVVSQHDESVSEQAQDTSLDTFKKCSEPLPSRLSESLPSSSVPSPGSPKSQQGTSALSALSVSEQAHKTSSDTSSESLPSRLSDESLPSLSVPSPGSPKPLQGTSAPSSFSASPPRIQILPVRSASALPELCQTSSASNLEPSITQHVHDMELDSDTSSSIETIPEDQSTQFSLEGKFAAFSISTLPPTSFSVEKASGNCESTRATSVEQCTDMSLQEQSTAVGTSNAQFEAECVKDSCSSAETYTETASIDDQKSSHEDSP